MAGSPIHRRQRGKNLFGLAVLLLLVAALFYFSMLKMGGQ